MKRFSLRKITSRHAHSNPLLVEQQLLNEKMVVEWQQTQYFYELILLHFCQPSCNNFLYINVLYTRTLYYFEFSL